MFWFCCNFYFITYTFFLRFAVFGLDWKLVSSENLRIQSHFQNFKFKFTSNGRVKDVTGHLQVSLQPVVPTNQQSNKVQFSETGLERLPATNNPSTICLVHSLQETLWNYDQCLQMTTKKKKIVADNQPMSIEKYDDELRFRISAKHISTHLIVLDANNQTLFWSRLPNLIPSSDADQSKGSVLHSENPESSYFRVEVMLVCPPGKHGPFCSVSCTPPTIRHWCDPKTGNLKCFGKWSGSDCNDNIFLGRNEASQFIKRRFKRANSWHKLEEVLPGNIERECREETCSYEEAREAFENNALTRKFWRAYTDGNDCSPNPCNSLNTVRCEDLIENYTCHCKIGYVGRNCQNEFDACQSQPCQNDAICQRLWPTSFNCSCQPGFQGVTCEENIDECVKSNCSSQGTCIDGVNSFTCRCTAGFTGSTCAEEIDECLSDPCVNGGTCSDEIDFYSCNCPQDYYGTNCQNRISPCDSEPCFNGGSCLLNDDYTYNCSCAPGFVGTFCQFSNDSACASSPCVNQGECYDKNSSSANSSVSQEFGCTCLPAYRGTRCEERIPACELTDNPCPHNSTCVSLDEDYICVCPKGFVGDQCQYRGEDEEALLELRCRDNACFNNARCLLINNVTVCVCRAGFNGTKCENEVDFCSPLPCMNNGRCFSVPTGFHCNCPEGFEGKTCENDVDECENQVNPCNNGTCNNTQGSFLCNCDPFHTGRQCEAPFDPCLSSPCQRGGTCRLTDTGYICDCLHGYGGTHCEFIENPCTNITSPCRNNANCTKDPVDPNNAVCWCPRGFYGRFCKKATDNCAVETNVTAFVNGEEIRQLRERDDCGSNGRCNPTRLGFNCVCNKGFEGRRCEMVYKTPVINCTSEDCLCPRSVLDEAKHHLGNRSRVQCQYRHYDFGYCDPVTCLTSSCPNSKDDSRCAWDSQCLTEYFKSGNKNNQESFFCPVIKVTLNTTNLKGTTVEDFCRQMRGIPAYRRHSNETLLHCKLLRANDSISTVAVAIDKPFWASEKQAVFVASDVFLTLEVLLPPEEGKENSESNFGLDPVFSRIISVEYSSFLGHSPQLSESEDQNDLLFIILIVSVIAFIIMILVVVIVRRRRAKKKELGVTYIVNPNAINRERNDSAAVAIAEGSPVGLVVGSTPGKSMTEDFVNPIFVEDRPVCHALTSNSVVQENPYVSSPKKTNPMQNQFSNSPEISGHDQKRRTSSEYEVMSSLTLPYDLRFPPKETNNLQQQNSTSDVKNSKTDVSYETMNFDRKRVTSKDGYEFIDFSSKTPQTGQNLSGESEKGTSSTSADKVYDFADDHPVEFRPQASDENISDQTENKLSKPTAENDNESFASTTKNCSFDKEEQIYQSPKPFFPKHDDLFFPEKKAETESMYSVPRQANPSVDV